MKRSSIGLFTMMAVSLIAFLQGCASLNPKELTHDRAQRLIEGDKSFTNPYVVALEGSEKFPVPAESPDEGPLDERAVELFYHDYPLTAALHQLGLVDAKAVMRERPKVVPLGGGLTNWIYKVESQLTVKGAALAGGRTDGLPLYKREVAEVTGVTVGQTNRAQVEFKWKRVPTPVGEALDPEGATFRSLPTQVQSGIKRSISRFGNALPTNYKKFNSGQAEFQLYDDGWRLEYVQL